MNILALLILQSAARLVISRLEKDICNREGGLDKKRESVRFCRAARQINDRSPRGIGERFAFRICL